MAKHGTIGQPALVLVLALVLVVVPRVLRFVNAEST